MLAATRTIGSGCPQLDLEQQRRGDQQHGHLEDQGAKGGNHPAAQDGRCWGRRGEQPGQRPVLLLLEEILGRGRAGEKDVKDHHPGHDHADDVGHHGSRSRP